MSVRSSSSRWTSAFVHAGAAKSKLLHLELQDISHCQSWSWIWIWISSFLCLLYRLALRDSVGLWRCCSPGSFWNLGSCGSFSSCPRRCPSFSVFFGSCFLCPFYEMSDLCCGPFCCSDSWTACFSVNLWPCSCPHSSSDAPSPWKSPASYAPCHCCAAVLGCVLSLSLCSFLVSPQSPSRE